MEELRGLLRELGYSEEDSNVIINDYVNDRYKPETLKERIRENFNFFYDLRNNKNDETKAKNFQF